MINENNLTADVAAEKPITDTPSSRRLKRIAAHIGARSYLEIGVARGATFNNVGLPRQVGVDPHFLFSTEAFHRAGVDFLAITSDEFFISRRPPETFDLIFLDGFHTFEQTFRDFCNSLTSAHDRTVWLIDDVLPIDPYSALRNHEDAVAFRKRAGITAHPGAWHGDVYKMVFMIHDFFPTLSYVTIATGGNPQTIVWKAPRAEFKPVLGKVESIDRLDYFDVQRRQSILNLLPDDDAFAFFFGSMRGKSVPAVPGAYP